jgi:hypothetical protein
MGTSPCVNVFLALDTWLYHYNVLVCYWTYLDFKIESNYVVISPEALLLLSDKSFNLDQLTNYANGPRGDNKILSENRQITRYFVI